MLALLSSVDRAKAAWRHMQHAIADLRKAMKDQRKQTVLVRRGMQVLIEDRAAARFEALATPGFRPRPDTSQPDSLRALLEVLELVGVDDRSFLDIGCGRSGGQSGFLAQRLGWRGLFVDASAGAVEAVRRQFGRAGAVDARQLEVTPENVNELAGSIAPIDLLNIDIDSYDYWVWQALEHRPRVAIVEYNSLLGRQPVTVPLGGIPDDAPKGYNGASLAALEHLGIEKGYRLLGCDHMGVNAYFARADLVGDALVRSVEEAWRPSLSRVDLDEVPRDPSELLREIEERELPLVSV